MRAPSLLTKGSIAAAALLAFAGTGCENLQTIAEEILAHADGGAGATCVYEGATYSPGSPIKSKDGCSHCQCDKSGAVVCQQVGCGFDGGTGTSCVEDKFLYNTECMTPESYQKIAEGACSDLQLTFGGLNLSSDCAGGYHGGTYTCCPPKGTPTQTCTKVDGGGGSSSCKPMSVWKTYGADTCAAQGMTLTDISYQGGCDKTGENFQDAIYVCCGAALPPPPPPPPSPPPFPCTKLSGGGGLGSCKPLSVWKTYGGEACNALGLSLSAVSGDTVCDQSGVDFQNAMYICCSGTADSNGIRCTTGANSDGTTCESCWDAYGAFVKTSCAAN